MTNDAVLSHEETQGLIAAAQSGDEQALDTLVRKNMPLVHSVAQKYRCRMEYDDLFQIGCIGLVKAIRKYDASFSVRFSTYAVPMIAGEIKRSLRDEGMLKVSRGIKELARHAMQVQEQLCRKNGREPTIDEIAQVIGCDAMDVAESLEAMNPCISIYEPAYDDSTATVGDRIASDDNTQEQILNDIFLQQALASLDKRDRQLIDMRFFRNMTQRQTAAMLGVSQVQVSRLETKIIKKLREYYLGEA